MIGMKPLKKTLLIQCSLIARLPLLLGMALLLSSCAQFSRDAANPSSAVAAPKPVEFVYKNPQAKKVCVVGDFNKWSTKLHCMSRSGDTWKLNMILPPGRYEYKFIVNGRNWREDPNATMSGKSGFGEQAENSVLIVE